jgi:ribosomal protein S18 acetylase RimI-like enzyme
MIIKASLQHAGVLNELGAETFYKSHKDSAPAHEIAAYMKKVYNLDAIEKELTNPVNIYHIIRQEDTAAGFSKMELTMKHPAIKLERVSKMDQIYLLDSFHGLKLGAKLLSHNIDFSKSHGQNGMWLVVWVGNTTAIAFYEKFGFRIVTRDQFHLTETHLSPCYIMLLEYASNKIS